MLTHDQLSTYVADRQQARMDSATASRAGRLLRRARAALGAAGPTGSAPAAGPAVTPVTTPVPTASSPVVAHATGSATGSHGDPAVAVLRTAATAGDPQAA